MRRRHGFTLVEMLVSITLVLFVMLILTEAFVKGLDVFRQLKAIGDMEQRLRVATTLLRRDLAADHFEGRKRLSDPNFFLQGPPREGFFRIRQKGGLVANKLLGVVPEGSDGDGLLSTRAVDHALHFTIKLRGNRREDFFSSRLPALSPLAFVSSDFFNHPSDARFQDPAGLSYNSQWAEVIYFLRPNGATAGGTPLYAIYRRQFGVVPDNRHLNWPQQYPPATPLPQGAVLPVPAAQLPNYYEISCKFNPAAPQFLYFNNPTDLTVPERRSGRPVELPPAALVIGPDYRTAGEQNAAVTGADLLLTDVLSFEVKVLLPESIQRTSVQPALDPFVDLFDSAAVLNNVAPLGVLQSANTLLPATGTLRVFDTWSSVPGDAADYSTWNNTTPSPTRIPLQLRILALQITLRVWDAKTEQARQITIVQDM
jgi:prepilin-type N-terminal cleavage/methylation domain-containing protein